MNRLSPRLGMVYELNDAINFYTSYSEGFIPLSGTDAQGKSFGFEESDSFEVGVKFGFDNVSATIALFDASKGNMLVADDKGYSKPIGKVSSKGIEVDLTGSLGENTQYTLSYAYVKAETAKEMINVEWLEPIPKGSPLVNVPKNNFSFSLAETIMPVYLSRTLNLAVITNIFHIHLGDPVNLSFNLPSYQLVGLFAKWQATDRTAVSLNVDNVFNEDYIVSSYNALWAYPGAPTQFKLGITYDF